LSDGKLDGVADGFDVGFKLRINDGFTVEVDVGNKLGSIYG